MRKVTLYWTFNSFPVAARCRRSTRRASAAWLSILSQLQPPEAGAALRGAGGAFQFFPSCSRDWSDPLHRGLGREKLSILSQLQLRQLQKMRPLARGSSGRPFQFFPSCSMLRVSVSSCGAGYFQFFPSCSPPSSRRAAGRPLGLFQFFPSCSTNNKHYYISSDHVAFQFFPSCSARRA